MSRVAGIVLAAGGSRRLGRPKQLLELDGRPLATHAASRALDSRCDEVIVVTGADGQAVEQALDGYAVRVVRNPRWEEGQGTSLAAGVAACGDDVDAAVILLADQPGIPVELIDRVIDAYRDEDAGIAMAEYGNQRGHPVLFARRFFPELLLLDADVGGRDIIRANRDALVLVDGGFETPPRDVDTEDAWSALQREWATGGADASSST